MGHDVIGMEQYVAEGSKPVERCQADVSVSDIYVVIVARRFGYQPLRTSSMPDVRSITEIERDRAKTTGKPVLAFLLDPQAPWPPNSVDAMGTEGGGSISRFRSELGADYLAGIFRTPDDLASQVAAAVSAQGLTRHMVARSRGDVGRQPGHGRICQRYGHLSQSLQHGKHQEHDPEVRNRPRAGADAG